MPEVAVSFNGTNIADGDASPSGTEGTDFGTVTQGTLVERVFRVDNIGTGTLTTAAPQLPPGFTVVEPLSPTITAGNFDTFTVRLDASSTGVKNGQISFTNDDDNENPFNFEISGAVTTTPVPEIVVSFNGTNIADGDASPSGSEGTDFGTVTQGTLVERVFRVDNIGTGTLTTSAPQLPPGFTVVEPLSPAITAGNFDTFTVRLDTSSTGIKNGQISFTNDDDNENPFNFEISGAVATTPAPEIAVSFNGASIVDGDPSPSGMEGTDFGTVTPGILVERVFRVDNNGTATLTTSGLQLPSGFAIIEPLSPTIAASKFDTFTVRMETSSIGTKNGQISFTTNDGDENPFEFSITGTVSQSPPPPTQFTLKPGPEGQDLWITNVFSFDDNFGVDNEQLKVGGWGDFYHSLLRFELAGASVPTQITSAVLRLYSVEAGEGSTPTGIHVDQLNTAWTESYGWHDYSLNYTNIATVSAPGLGWFEIDVTSAVNNWLSNPSSNFGIQLRPVGNNNNFDFFVSSDATGAIAQFRPELVIRGTGTANPAPTNIALSDSSAPENSPLDAVVGTLSATDPGDATAISLINSAGGRFAINGSNLLLVSALDFEAATSHGIRVRATDTAGNIYEEDFTIAVANVNETPTGAALSDNAVTENAPNGTVVGTVTGQDRNR